MKRCGKCGEDKPLGDFNRDKRSTDGRQRWCRSCQRTYARATYGKDLEASRAKQRAYLATRNREELNTASSKRNQKYRETRPDLAREKNKRARKKLRETHPNYYRDWYRLNAEERREQAKEHMRAFRRNHPERARAIRRRYRKKNIDAIRQRQRETSYARRVKQPYSRGLAKLMAELVQYPCVYCGATEDMTIDHVVPLARGGKHEAENLAPACRPCNCSKNDRLLSEWKGRL